MSFKSEGNFELIFNNESEFEIICADQGNVAALQDILVRLPFVANVLPAVDLAQTVPYKISGNTTNQDGLIEELKDWDKALAGMEVTQYKDFDD